MQATNEDYKVDKSSRQQTIDPVKRGRKLSQHPVSTSLSATPIKDQDIS